MNTIIQIEGVMIEVKEVPVSDYILLTDEMKQSEEIKKMIVKKYTDLNTGEKSGLVNAVFEYIINNNELSNKEFSEKITSDFSKKINQKIEYQLIILLKRLNYEVQELLKINSKKLMEIFLIEVASGSFDKNKIIEFCKETFKSDLLIEFINVYSSQETKQAPSENDELIRQLNDL